MTPRDAAVAVLAEAEGPLHWTVVLDRALRAGYLDPFTTPDLRAQMLDALRGLAAEGAISRPETGVYVRNPEG